MKRFVCMFIIAALGLALCACTHTPASVPTPAPAESPAAPQFSLIPATPAPQESGSMADIFAHGGGTELGEADGVTYSEERVLYPEGADEASALFTLEYNLPVFGGGFIGANNANAEVAEYKDELLTRAAEEYLPYADGEGAAYARVISRVTRADGLTNIFLSETAVFGDADADTKLGAMVLDAFGERLSLASAAMVYEAEPLAAQQIFNMIEASPSAATYGDVTVDTIALAIDIYSGFFAAEQGYGVIIPAGTIAAEEQGALSFIIPKDAFYPECVGETITAAEYERLRGPLNDLAAACALDYSDFDSSSPAPYVASAFMNRIFTRGTEDIRSVAVNREEYERAYYSYFASTVPESVYSDGDGTYAEGGSVMLPVYPHADYVFRIDDAAAEGDNVTVYGMICSGTPGTAEAYELTYASALLTRDDSAACGFVLVNMQLR
ncbi:MAG: hypothetical protein KH409_02720 [Clostridium sp.]|nr:hypothetical protein [Clostridium sp.]